MSSVSSLVAPLGRFYAAAGLALPVVEPVSAEEMPAEAQRLLQAAGPLTPRLEQHHGEPLALRVLERRRHGNVYGRRIVLVRRDGVPVVLGAIEIDLARLSPSLRARVLEEEVPFGHLVADAAAHPEAFLRFTADPIIAAALEIPNQRERLYGRRRTLIDGHGATVAAIVEVLAPPLAAGVPTGGIGS